AGARRDPRPPRARGGHAPRPDRAARARPREARVQPRGHDPRRPLRDGRGARRERAGHGPPHLRPVREPRAPRHLAVRAGGRSHRAGPPVMALLLGCDPYALWPEPEEVFPWVYTPETDLPDYADVRVETETWTPL